MTAPADGQRLDRWLWHARFARTRGLAQQAVEAGAVRVNRQKVGRSSFTVRIGDVLTIRTRDRVSVVRIVGLAERRVGASLMPSLYTLLETEDGTPATPAERGTGLLDDDDQTG